MLTAFLPSSTEFVKVFQLLVLHIHEQGKREGLIKQGFLSNRSHPVLKINFCAGKMHIDVVILKRSSSVHFSSWLLMVVLEILNDLLGGKEGDNGWIDSQASSLTKPSSCWRSC